MNVEVAKVTFCLQTRHKFHITSTALLFLCCFPSKISPVILVPARQDKSMISLKMLTSAFGYQVFVGSAICVRAPPKPKVRIRNNFLYFFQVENYTSKNYMAWILGDFSKQLQ